MDAATEGPVLVIKMARKNKETQTVKGGGDLPSPHANWFGPPNAFAVTGVSYPLVIPSPATVPLLSPTPTPTTTPRQFYMDREEELYRRACQMKGIRVERINENELQEEEDSVGSEEEPAKVIYRYTLDEMKSYNPYRFINF